MNIVDIPGWSALVDWFGYSPEFHDFEILNIELHTDKPSRLRIHGWRVSRQPDESGFYHTDRHVIINFLLADISEIDLRCWYKQNVISELKIIKNNKNYVFNIESSYGVDGKIVASDLSIELDSMAAEFNSDLS